MMKVTWLGGPRDGDVVELPVEPGGSVHSIEIVLDPGIDIRKAAEGSALVGPPKFRVPIRNGYAMWEEREEIR